MIDELKNSPAYTNDAYKRQSKALEIVSDVYDGTDALVAKGTIYLPQEERESMKAYDIRLQRATFYNAYKRTIAGLVGMVFRKNPVLSAGVVREIKFQTENIDLQGNHLDVFSKQLFEKAVNHGHALILVDMPPRLSQGATLADERAAGRRPYWQIYEKGQVVNFQTETVNGKVQLIQVTLKEIARETDGRFGEKRLTRYRVLMPGKWEIWEQRGSDQQPILVKDGETNLSDIPLVPIYAAKRGILESKPPLLDLAYQNLRHYRLTSDLDRILHKASVPILYFVNRDTGKKAETISPDAAIDVSENGSVGWAEITGTSIDKAQEEIKNVEGRMAALGLSVIAEQPKSARTATETVVDYEAETSELASMARSLQDGLEIALDYHAQFLGAKPGNGGEITVNKDFTQLTLDAQTLGFYSNMVAANQLSLETLWSVLQRAEKLPDDFDVEVEKERLSAVV